MPQKEEEKFTGLKGFVKHPRFGQAIMLCILVNTVVLACDGVWVYDSANKSIVDALDLINEILTFVFLIEMILNIAGLGAKEYFGDAFSCFDAAIVVVSMFDFIYSKTSAGEDGGGGGAISALRGARLLRILKMAKEWETMQTLLRLIAKTVLEIGNFGILLVLFIFIYSLCGMQFFSNRMVFDSMDAPVDIADWDRWLEYYPDRMGHFDTLLWSMVTIFQVLTGEDWNWLMYDAWRCAEVPELAILYFLSLVITGAFIVMNLFLAILLSNFEGNEDLMKDEPTGWQAATNSTEALVVTKQMGKFWKGKAAAQSRPSFAQKTTEEKDKIMNELSQVAKEKAQEEAAVEIAKAKAEEEAKAKAEEEAKVKAEEEEQAGDPHKYISCYLFYPDNPVRLKCEEFSEHPFFDQFILACILISSLCLALDNPLSDQESTFNQILKALDLIFSVIFMMELIVKVISLGFLFHPGSYLRNPWNMLDAAIVLISILSLAEAVEGGSLKALRTFRVLRPLRMIKRFPELKLVVDALVSSVPDALNVIVVSCLFLLLFAILGVNLYKGAFWVCDTEGAPDEIADFINQYPLDFRDKLGGLYIENYPARQTWADFNATTSGAYESVFLADTSSCQAVVNAGKDKVTSKSVCDCYFGEDSGNWGEVISINQNFDNVGEAFNLLFEITTTEGWITVMMAAVDSMGYEMQPKRGAHLANIGFFILFMLIGAFFVMELFVGVVIDNFNRLRDSKGGGSVLMTEEQEDWAKTQAFIMKIKPEKKIPPPTGVWDLWCYNMVMPNINPRFDQFIMSCIIGNSVVMAAQHHEQEDSITAFIEYMNYLFALIFTIEALLKLFAMKMKYFRDPWNKFDFAVVLGTNFGILLYFATGSGVGPVASIVRMFRIGRLVRLINSAKSIRTLFNTLILSIPSMGNIGFLLLILFFIFSVMGVQAYAKVALVLGDGPGGGLDQHANFQGLGESFLLLFR